MAPGTFDPKHGFIVSGGDANLVDCELRRGNFESRQLRAVAVSAVAEVPEYADLVINQGLTSCDVRGRGEGCYLATDSKHYRLYWVGQLSSAVFIQYCLSLIQHV